MAQYVDGFVLPIPKDKVDLYRSIAEGAAKIWREHGALEYRECIAEDMDAKEMVLFLQLAGAGPDETVVFAWILFESRSSRDEVNAKVMADERLKGMCEKGPGALRLQADGLRWISDVGHSVIGVHSAMATDTFSFCERLVWTAGAGRSRSRVNISDDSTGS